MPIANIAVVLVKTRFPENIGMVARACANMGFSELILVQPERWDFLKAEPLATSQGIAILDTIRVVPDLAGALAQFNYVVGTTARQGAWRQGMRPPDDLAPTIIQKTNAGQKIALVFGPEDRGLVNEEIAQCQALINIGAETGSNSLNLAQAVLIVLYECRKAARNLRLKPKTPEFTSINHSELAVLENNFRITLESLDCLSGKNPGYYFRLWQNLLGRLEIARHEYDALMGFCRQLRNKLKR